MDSSNINSSNVGANFQSDGFVGPIDAISKDDAAICLKEVQHELSNEGSSRFKLHLVLPCIDNIARHPKLVSAVQQALGSDNLLLWSSDVNSKDATSPFYFEPHQDSAYAGLSSSQQYLTAWVALSDHVGVLEGCLQFYPQSHKMGRLFHSTTQSNQNNLLSLGQFIPNHIIDKLQNPVSVPLRGGQATLHSFDTVHSSSPNKSSTPRVGLALRYITQGVIQTNPHREMATWISGSTNKASTTHFDMEPRLPKHATMREIENGRKIQKEALAREEANYFSLSATEKISFS